MSNIEQQVGNDTDTNVKKITVEGLGEVIAEEKGSVVSVEIPNDIISQGADAIESYKRKVNDYVTTGSKTYKERQEFNSSLDSRNAELEKAQKELERVNKLIAEKKNFSTQTVDTNAPTDSVPSIESLFAEKLGKELESNEELFDAMEENPRLYSQAVERRQEMLIERNNQNNINSVNSQIQQNSLSNEIRKSGFTVSDVEAFKLKNGFTDIKHAFEFFKTQNHRIESPIDILNNAEATKKTVSFVNAGDISSVPKRKTNDMTADEIQALPQEEVARRYKELISGGQ